jgi:transcriptional regulator with XRE-family HTH domain
MLTIKRFREARGLNMRETAKLLGMPYTTYVNYEKGTREPTSEVLIHLADFFGVSTDQLLGRPAPTPNLPPLSIFPLPEINFTDEEIEMIVRFRSLDSRGKSAVLNALNHEYESLPGEKADPAPKEA